MTYPTLDQAVAAACRDDVSEVELLDVAWLCHRSDTELSSVRFAVGELLAAVRAAGSVGRPVPPAELDELAEGVTAALDDAEREVQAAEVLARHLGTVS